MKCIVSYKANEKSKVESFEYDSLDLSAATTKYQELKRLGGIVEIHLVSKGKIAA